LPEEDRTLICMMADTPPCFMHSRATTTDLPLADTMAVLTSRV
jgi:hypothetical protein